LIEKGKSDLEVADSSVRVIIIYQYRSITSSVLPIRAKKQINNL